MKSFKSYLLEEKIISDAKIAQLNKKHGLSGELSRKLVMSMKQTHPIISFNKHQSIKDYTGGNSGEINSTLADWHSYDRSKGIPIKSMLSPNDYKTHSAIHEFAHPAGHEFHLFSGANKNFQQLAPETKDNIFHMAAHTSMTHNWPTAITFTKNKSSLEAGANMIHVHIKPTDIITHVSGMSHHTFEHETILPSDTKLKYHKTTTIHIGVREHVLNAKLNKYEYKEVQRPVNVHHFTIHNKED